MAVRSTRNVAQPSPFGEGRMPQVFCSIPQTVTWRAPLSIFQSGLVLPSPVAVCGHDYPEAVRSSNPNNLELPLLARYYQLL